MCIEPRPVSSCCPPTLTPFFLSLSLFACTYTRAPLFAPTRREVWWKVSVCAVASHVCIRMPDLPQRESHCAVGECLLFSRVRVSPPLFRHPLIHGSVVVGGEEGRAKDRAGIGPRGGDERRARGDGGGGGVGCARSSAARCTHSRWGIPRRRFASLTRREGEKVDPADARTRGVSINPRPPFSLFTRRACVCLFAAPQICGGGARISNKILPKLIYDVYISNVVFKIGG